MKTDYSWKDREINLLTPKTFTICCEIQNNPNKQHLGIENAICFPNRLINGRQFKSGSMCLPGKK